MLVLVTAARRGLLSTGGPAAEVSVVQAAQCDRAPAPVSGFFSDSLGSAAVRVLVDTSGSVAGAVVVRGTGESGRDSAAVRMARAARFTRPRRRGLPVMCLLVLKEEP